MFKSGVNWAWPTTVFQSVIASATYVAHPSQVETLASHFQTKAFKALLLAEVQSQLNDYGQIYGLANIQLDSVDVEIWREGTYATYATGSSEHMAIIYLAQSCATDPSSGSLLLHDPRVGADNIFVPHLPVGRTMKFTPAKGRCIVFPGSLRYSISCVRGGDWLIIARLSL